MKKYKVIIVDDHQLFRNGLKFIINNLPDLEVTADLSNGSEFLEVLDYMVPDIVLMDISMPVMNGVEASAKALEKHPDLNILILSMFSDAEYYNTMIDIGVKGFILKDVDNKELRDAILKIINGGTYFSQELLLNLIRQNPKEEQVQLSKREIEILELICRGYSNQQIADKLFISQRTVERHRSNLMQKTETKNSISLVVYAIKNHLVQI